MKEDEPKNRKPKGHEHENSELAEVHGTVVHYLLNPWGEVDGLLLEDGTSTKFPPHLGRELTQVAKPKDQVWDCGGRAKIATLIVRH